MNGPSYLHVMLNETPCEFKGIHSFICARTFIYVSVEPVLLFLDSLHTVFIRLRTPWRTIYRTKTLSSISHAHVNGQIVRTEHIKRSNQIVFNRLARDQIRSVMNNCVIFYSYKMNLI